MPLSVRNKIAAAFGSALLVLIVGAVSLLSVRQLMRANDQVERTNSLIGKLTTVASEMVNAETGQRGYIITGDTAYLYPYTRSKKFVRQHLADLRLLSAGNIRLTRRVDSLTRLVDLQLADLSESVDLRLLEGFEPAAAEIRTDRTKLRMDRIRNLVEDMAAEEKHVLVRNTGVQRRTSRIAPAIIIGGAFLAFLLALLINMGLRRDVRSLLRVQSSLEHQKNLLNSQTSEMELQQAILEQTNRDLARANIEEESAHARFQLLLDSTDAGVYGIDLAGHCTFINRAGAHMLGYEAGELLGRMIHRVIHHTRTDGSPYPVADCRIYKAYIRGEAWTDDSEVFWHRDGTAVPVEYSSAPTKSAGEITGAVVSYTDITARKQAESRREFLALASTVLARSLDYDVTLAEVAGLAVPGFADWCLVNVVQHDGSILCLAAAHSDPMKEEMAREIVTRFPSLPDDLVGPGEVIRSGEPALVPEIADEQLRALARTDEHYALLHDVGFRSCIIAPLVGRGRTVGALTLIMAESGRRYDDDSFEVAKELARRVSGAIDNALLYREAGEARVEAEEANQAKSQFLAAMSHELRTPLNAIAGYSELVAIGIYGPVTPAQTEALGRIRRSQQTLLSLINDILNYARIEAGHLTVELKDVALDEILATIDALVEPQLRAKHLMYRYEACPESTQARGDADKIQQVLLNLLSNAVKFTPPGGEIVVSCHLVEKFVEIRVRDTGRGVPIDKLESIFEPFVQIDRDINTNLQGTGLGLAISRDLARAMGGNLCAQSEVGKGSTFVFTLPGNSAG